MRRPEWNDGTPHNFKGEAQEVTYLQRSITLSEKMNMIAYISSDDGLHVWLNDILIFENDTDRGLERSQETIPLPLEKGENKVIMKINNRGALQGFYFSLLPDLIVYEREVEKIWNLTSLEFSDKNSIFPVISIKTIFGANP